MSIQTLNSKHHYFLDRRRCATYLKFGAKVHIRAVKLRVSDIIDSRFSIPREYVFHFLLDAWLQTNFVIANTQINHPLLGIISYTDH